LSPWPEIKTAMDSVKPSMASHLRLHTYDNRHQNQFVIVLSCFIPFFSTQKENLSIWINEEKKWRERKLRNFGANCV